MTYRAFRVSYFPEKRGEVEVSSITDYAMAHALGVDWDQVRFAKMKIGNRRFVAVIRDDYGIECEHVPVTAISFDPLGVPIVEARGDFLVLHAKGKNKDAGGLVMDEVNYLRGKFVQVPNNRDREITALGVEWIA